MYKYPRYVNIDYAKYEGDITDETMYGLPKDVVFCKECVISNQRPNSCQEFLHKRDSKKETIHFGSDGVCDGCRANWDKQYHIDWTEREKELIEVCDKYRKNDGSYDCIVPGSGGKDSFYTSHILMIM